ncbi:MAG: hypothetical protein ACXACY_27890 [Candidatus Hodarchaeales archaeon]|jgi:hypothetical protein
MENKELIELMKQMRTHTPDERLEMFLEAARVVGLKELEQAIIGYWFDCEYVSMQEKSIKVQSQTTMGDPDEFCLDCGKPLHNLNTVEIELIPGSDPEIIKICSDCDVE